jgi:hypothetical protein
MPIGCIYGQRQMVVGVNLPDGGGRIDKRNYILRLGSST